jgi:cytochrome c oxidase subunit 3
MSQTTDHAMTAGHEHSPHLAHHFTSMRQQVDSHKLGMWVFLATEILMFGGLFCAYAVYRGNHPDVFVYAHQHLNMYLGAINTVVLLVSSFTMAYGVRAAQLGQRKLLMVLLALTFLGGVGFMGIKSVEYRAKWNHGLWVGVSNLFYPGNEAELKEQLPHLERSDAAHAPSDTISHEATEHAAEAAPDAAVTAEQVAAPAGPDYSMIEPAAQAPAGTTAAVREQDVATQSHESHAYRYEDLSAQDRSRVHMFFQIYFLMTGLHGLHVLIGMALIAWVLVRAGTGVFGPAYYTPVDLVGLYWHLVDLIWIFLFPLLYLIH